LLRINKVTKCIDDYLEVNTIDELSADILPRLKIKMKDYWKMNDNLIDAIVTMSISEETKRLIKNRNLLKQIKCIGFVIFFLSFKTFCFILLLSNTGCK
jgi:hypothetical protein